VKFQRLVRPVPLFLTYEGAPGHHQAQHFARDRHARLIFRFMRRHARRPAWCVLAAAQRHLFARGWSEDDARTITRAAAWRLVLNKKDTNQ